MFLFFFYWQQQKGILLVNIIYCFQLDCFANTFSMMRFVVLTIIFKFHELSIFDIRIFLCYVRTPVWLNMLTINISHFGLSVCF